MTRLELTDDGAFPYPRPGGPHMDNLIATMLRHGNRTSGTNLDRIAEAQGFNKGEFAARFAHLETAWDAHLSAESLKPSNKYEEGGEGK